MSRKATIRQSFDRLTGGETCVQLETQQEIFVGQAARPQPLLDEGVQASVLDAQQ